MTRVGAKWQLTQCCSLARILLLKSARSIMANQQAVDQLLEMKVRKRKIVIIGGGFAGAFAAKYLSRFGGNEFELELVNSTNYFVFQPLLPEVVSGTISAPDAVTPLRYMLPGVKVRMAEVTSIDMDAQQVNLLQGSRRFPQSIEYDQLIIAVGQKTDRSSQPGLAVHSLCMRDLSSAHEIRNQVIRCLEHADITENPDVRRRLLTFVVSGGGFSGVETIGELVEMIRRTLRFYPNISDRDIQTILIQRDDRILPELSPKLGQYAEQKLRKRNVQILLNTQLTSVTARDVYLDNGTCLATDTLITTAGSGPRVLTTNLDLELQRGKIAVDEFLRVPGRENVWCIGDAALIPLPSKEGADIRYAPPTAQFAVREARIVSRNIVASHNGEQMQAFSYQPKGSLASIGNYKAVAEIFGIRLSGLLAWLMWRGLYIGMLPGFSTRLRVALNWLFDYFLPRSIVQIANNPETATTYRYYAAGDVICRPGQTIDGLYTVISGAMESRIPGQEGHEDFVRILGPGDHWGERSLANDTLAVGTLTATEKTLVLVLQRSDFVALSAAFPPLQKYFDGISDETYAPSLRGVSKKRPD